jgi:hypothetical protein
MKTSESLQWYTVRCPSLGRTEHRARDFCIDASLGADNLLLYRGNPRREDPIQFWRSGNYRFFRSLGPAKRYAELWASAGRMP